MAKHGIPGFLLHLVFPSVCTVCGNDLTAEELKKSECLCSVCLEELNSEIAKGCPSCAGEYAFCKCRPHDFLPDGFTYVLPYNGTDKAARELILKSKNHRNIAVAEELAKRMYINASANGFLRDGDGNIRDIIVTFAPRTVKKRVSLGFDQAEELAVRFAKLSGVKEKALFRRTGNALQQKTLSASERFRNVYFTMKLKHGAGKKIAGKTVILVDDVVTSGATVNICTGLLKDAGADKVFCVSAARSIKTTLRDFYDAPQPQFPTDDFSGGFPLPEKKVPATRKRRKVRRKK